MNPLIRAENLKKYFSTQKGRLHAVDGINLTINAGATLGVVGESGCGKSTLGRVMLRLLEASAGAVYFAGKDLLKMSKRELEKFRKQAQIIFQDPYASLNPRLSVCEIIMEPLIVNKIYRTKREMEQCVFQMMQTVGLAARLINSYPHELDGGRRQRIGIARALVLKPRFIVCDEPVSALDVSIQAQILNLLMDLQEELGLTYMFITHDLSVVRHISDEIAVMYLGQCIEKAPAKELFHTPLHPYTKALLSAIPLPSLARRGRKRELLKGEIVSPIEPKAGCRFAPRCHKAGPGCAGRDIPFTQHLPGHFAACLQL